MFTTLTSRGLAVTLFIALAILIFNPETDADYDAGNIEGVSYSITVNQVRKKSTGTQSWHRIVVDNRSGSAITITWEFAHWIHKLDSESEDITDTPFEDKIWEVQTIPTRKLGSNDHYFRFC